VPVRAVVFDLFDTLVDLRLERLPAVEIRGRRLSATAPLLHEVVRGSRAIPWDDFAAILSEVDRGFVESHYRAGRELPTLERFGALARRLGIPGEELPARLTRVHMRRLREQVSVPEHHASLLAVLRARARLGICSNFSHADTAFDILREGRLAGAFHAVVISERQGFRKPRREIFEAVLAELGTAPEETLHVGDSLSADVAGAAALGIRTAWLTRRVPDPEAALRAHAGPAPDHALGDLGELPALLERL